MLKKALFICFIFFNFYLLQCEENLIQPTDEWKNINGKEIVFFVNNINKSQKKPDGSKKAPFKKIEDVFTHLSGIKKKDIKATIHVIGRFSSKNVYVITVPTRIIGVDELKGESEKKVTSSYISFEKNAGFVATSSKLFIEKCTISRKEFVGEPRSVPVLYSSNSLISMKNVSLKGKEGGSLFKFIDSDVSMQDVIFNSEQNGYCNIIEAVKSDIKIKNAHFNCNARFVVPIEAKNSFFNIENLHCDIFSHLSAVVLKADGGKVNIQKSSFIAKGKYASIDEAISHDETTKLNIKDVELKGFSREAKLKKD
ncbi:MAG: hypothetical protein ACTTJ3_01655 [Treponema sp.]